MRARRVLVTGVSGHLGARLAAVLAASGDVDAVVGVDTAPPRLDLGRAEFVRADIRSPLIAKVVAGVEIDTVVHLNVVATPAAVGGRAAMKEINVIGTMQLLAACQSVPTVRRLVLKSTTAVYGSSPQDPALFTEDMEPRRLPRGYAKDAVEVEGYARGFGRRRPDVTVSVLRFANFVGPRIDTPLTRYFALPVVPTVLGFDPRLQFCHEDDAVEVLRRATVEHHPGVHNVGGDGVLLLSQAIRRAGRVALPVAGPLVSAVGRSLRRSRLVDFSSEQVDFLRHGRVADTTRLRERFGFTPRYSTAAAFDDFVRARGLRTVVPPERVAAVERLLLSRLTGAGLDA